MFSPRILSPASLLAVRNRMGTLDVCRIFTVAAIPFMAVSFLAWLLTSFLIAESLEWETALVKEVISQGAVVRYEEVKDLEEARSERSVWIVRGVILAVSVVLIVLGVMNGGMRDVLGKAIKICTECIGLG